MKKIILIAFIWFFAALSYSQQVLPVEYEIKTDTPVKQNLSVINIQILADKKGKWTIDQISAPPLSDKFQSITGNIPLQDSDIHTYWYRFKLKNSMNTQTSIALQSRSDQDDYFIFRPGRNLQHFVTGNFVPWNKKDGFKQGNYIPITLTAGEQLWIYQRSFADGKFLSDRFPISFVSANKEMQNEFYKFNTSSDNYFHINEMLEAFIIGLLLISFFFNLFFYRIVHDKIYLYFSLYLLFLGFNRFYNITYVYLGWARPDLSQNVWYIGYAWIFIDFYFIQFSRKFFNIHARFPKWDKFLNILRYSYGIIEILLFVLKTVFKMPYLFSSPIGPFIWNFIPWCLLITLVIFIPKSNRLTRLVIMGAFPLLLFYVEGTIFASDGLFRSTLGNSEFTRQFEIYDYRLVEAICITWLVLFFSRVLFLRYIELQKQIIQQEQNIRNRIAADLHDDIGSTLSSISIMSELAKSDSPTSGALLNSISEGAAAIQESMSDLVWAINPQNDRFNNVIQRMNQFASEILEAKSIDFHFTCKEGDYNEGLSGEQRKKIYLFFKEAINNAAKYSGATRVEATISVLDGRITLVIEDNGRGFDLAIDSSGNGLANFRQRADELGGSLTFESTIGEGTKIALSFKIT